MKLSKTKVISHIDGVIHVFNRLLCSLLTNEVGQGSWHIRVLRSVSTDLFFAEIYKLKRIPFNFHNKKKNTWDKLVGKNSVLHDGRGFNAFGLTKILGINGVLLLSTFSLNFSCGLATFLA